MSELEILAFVILIALAALAYAAFNFVRVRKMEEGTERMQEIASAIRVGANAFVTYEYKILLVVGLVIAAALSILVSWQTAGAFLDRRHYERLCRLDRHEDRHLCQCARGQYGSHHQEHRGNTQSCV